MPDKEIVFDRVSKRFGSSVALEDINLEIDRGEFVCIIGPSGCGKSVLLRLISGFDAPTEGAVYIRGQNVNHVPAHKRGIPTVFQSFALFPHMTVFDNIAYGLKVRKMPEEEITRRVRAVMDTLDIPELGSRYPNQVSGGQKQRVGLARALVVDPQMLLLDEPLGALDANLRVRMQSELKALHKKLGITFVLVTANRTEAFTMGSRVIVMDKARIVQIGTPEEIKYSPASEYVARFCGHSNIFRGTVARVTDDGVDVDSVLGLVRLPPSANGVKPGDEVKIFIRPDGVILPTEGRATGSREEEEDPNACVIFSERAPRSDDNRLQAAFRFAEFGGPIVNLFFELEDGTTLVVEKEVDKLGKLERGQVYDLYWSLGCAGIIS